MGEKLEIHNPANGLVWWRSVEEQEQRIGKAIQVQERVGHNSSQL